LVIVNTSGLRARGLIGAVAECRPAVVAKRDVFVETARRRIARAPDQPPDAVEPRTARAYITEDCMKRVQATGDAVPMPRLFKPLAFALAGSLAIAACEPTAENTPQSLAYERQQSQQLVQELEARDMLVEDRALNRYVRSVVNKIERTRPAGSVPIEAYIVKDADVNAFTPGGGYLFVHAGLLAAMENEAQFANVIAHEIGHIDRGHIQAGMQTRSGVQLGAAAAQIGGAILGIDPNLTQLGVGLGANLAVSSFTRTQERDADATGVQYLANAGYDVVEGARSFEVLGRLYGDGGVPLFATHPPTGERQQALVQAAAQHGATSGYVGEAEYDRAVRPLRQEVLQFYERSGRNREAAQVRQNLR
jgi:hypothetical protein